MPPAIYGPHFTPENKLSLYQLPSTTVIWWISIRTDKYFCVETWFRNFEDFHIEKIRLKKKIIGKPKRIRLKGAWKRWLGRPNFSGKLITYWYPSRWYIFYLKWWNFCFWTNYLTLNVDDKNECLSYSLKFLGNLFQSNFPDCTPDSKN